MPDLPLPLTIEEITPEWLEAALRTRAQGVELRGFEIIDMIRGTCTKIRLKLDFSSNPTDIPETVILKGGFEPHSRDMHVMHEKEVRAYADVLGPLGLRSPRPFFTGYSAAQKQGIVIMEDLVARGVTFCSPLRPQTFEAVARRLGDLARFHAQTWDSAGFAPGGRWDWVEDVPKNQLNYFGYFLQPEIWKSFVASPRGAASSTRFHDLGWISDALNRLAALSATLPHCVNHGDTHLGNLYVDVDGTPGFFDSLAGRAPAMLEVTYHICGALDPADRPRWEAALVQHYLDELRRAGVDAPPFGEAMRQYGIFLVFGFFIFIVNDAVFQSEAVNTAYTARFSAAMLAHDTIGKLLAVQL